MIRTMERQRTSSSNRQIRSCRIFFVLFVTACVATAPHILECACWGIKTRCVYLWTRSWIDKRFFACAVPSPLKKDSADAPTAACGTWCSALHVGNSCWFTAVALFSCQHQLSMIPLQRHYQTWVPQRWWRCVLCCCCQVSTGRFICPASLLTLTFHRDEMPVFDMTLNWCQLPHTTIQAKSWRTTQNNQSRSEKPQPKWRDVNVNKKNS